MRRANLKIILASDKFRKHIVTSSSKIVDGLCVCVVCVHREKKERNDEKIVIRNKSI